MLACAETEGQHFRQCVGFPALCGNHVNQKIIPAEFPHDLTAHTAGRAKLSRRLSLGPAYHSDGRKFPLALIHSRKDLEEFLKGK